MISLLSSEKDLYEYLKVNDFTSALNIEFPERSAMKKHVRPVMESVDHGNQTPYSPEWDDLIRLHHLVTSRKVTKVLEFGVGYSTAVFDHAIELNKSRYSGYVEKNLRRDNPWRVVSVDNYLNWIEHVKGSFNLRHVDFHFSTLEMSTFNGRICTLYESLPNICPDLVYIDGPDQYNVKGEVRGISTRSVDRLPMLGDVLAMEYFFHPGTLIVLDGRTANARFLKNNFQRNWEYTYSEDFDQSFLELVEEPLGLYNKRHLDFVSDNSL